MKKRVAVRLIAAGALGSTMAMIGALAGCSAVVDVDKAKDAGRDARDTGYYSDPNDDYYNDNNNSYDSGYYTPYDSGYNPNVNGQCDTVLNRSQVGGCEDFIEGAVVCAKNKDINYPVGNGFDRTRDLLTCSKFNGPSCIIHCQTGCAQLPDGFKDQCDPCQGRTNGTYCGSDFQNWPRGMHDRLRVRCDNGVMTAATECGFCNSNGANGNAQCN